MKLSQLKGYALAAVLGAASLVPTGAHAGITAGAGDVILGFRASAGAGATINYTVKLGQASQFTGATGVLDLNSIGADLTAIYGSNWRSRTDLFFGVMGATDSFVAVGGDAAKTLYASKARPSAATTATAWSRAASGAQGSSTSQVNGLRSGLALGSTKVDPSNGASASLSSPTTVTTRLTTDLNSWNSYLSGGAAFTLYNPTIEALAGSSADFFRLTVGSGAGDFLGTFNLGADGLVRFVPATLAADLATGGVISVSTPDVSATSGSTSAVVTLTRTGGLNAASVLVSTATITGGAATPADFAAITGQTVNFAVGQASANVTVTLTGVVLTSTKSFNVTISSPTGATLGTVTTAKVRIRSSSPDTTAPVLALAAPVSNAVVSSAKAAVFSGTYTEANLESLTLAFNGGATVSGVPAAGKFSKSFADETAATAAGIVAGNNTVVVAATDGDGNVTTVTRTFFYEKLVPVTVTSTNGLLTFTPKLGGTTVAPTAAIGRTYTVSAKANTAYFFGTYSGTADISSTTTASSTVQFDSGETLVANFTESPFNLAGGVNGTYNGIVKGSAAADTQANAGILNVLVALNTGAFTGKLNVDGQITTVAGVFNNVTGVFATPTVSNGVVYNLDLDFTTKVITGTITKRKRGADVSVVNVNAPQAYTTAAFTPAVAYNVAFSAPDAPAELLSDEYPHGNGYGVLTIGANAGAKLVGVLADGTAFTSSSVVCKPVSPATENTVPVYASFAAAKGALVGNATITAAAAVTGTDFRWFKSENSGQYYPYGFALGADTGLTIDIAAGGLQSAATAPTITNGTSTLSLSGGGFALTNGVINGTTTKISFKPTTNVMSGSYTTPAGINLIGGIVVGSTAYGYILTPLPTHIDGSGQGGLVSFP